MFVRTRNSFLRIHTIFDKKRKTKSNRICLEVCLFKSATRVKFVRTVNVTKTSRSIRTKFTLKLLSLVICWKCKWEHLPWRVNGGFSLTKCYLDHALPTKRVRLGAVIWFKISKTRFWYKVLAGVSEINWTHPKSFSPSVLCACEIFFDIIST